MASLWRWVLNEFHRDKFPSVNRLNASKLLIHEVCFQAEKFAPLQYGVSIEAASSFDQRDQMICNDIFVRWTIPGLFLIIFVFSNKHYNIYSKYMWKNVHPVYSGGIWRHDLQNLSLLP